MQETVTKRSDLNRAKVRQMERESLLDWYINVAGHLPAQQCEETKAYNSTVLWWLDPPIPGVMNPVLVEETVGDIWTIKRVPRVVTIKSYGGL